MYNSVVSLAVGLLVAVMVCQLYPLQYLFLSNNFASVKLEAS